MPRFIDKYLNGGISNTGEVLPYRDSGVVDIIVGLKRKAVQIGTAFWNWPIAQAYPQWHQFQQQIAEERVAAVKEGREPHPAVKPPGISRHEKIAAELGPDIPYTHRGGKWRPKGKNLGPKHPVKNSIKNPKA